MSSIFGKLFENINKDDLQGLITQEVEERQNLEYKSQAYKHNDDDTREMLRDITSMVNAYGGYLFLGVEEKEDNSGIPAKLVGINKAEPERDRILSSCLANIEPRISGLQARAIKLDDNKSVLAIFIPKSPRAPHLITFKGLYQFWVRHDRQKSRMSVEEIKDKFLTTENILQDIQTFLERRRDEILKEIGTNHSFYVIGALPLLIKEDIVDIFDQRIRDLLKNPPGQRSHGYGFDFSTHADMHPTLYGLKIEIKDYRSIELFRNGYCEAKIDINDQLLKKDKIPGTDNDCFIINPYFLVEYPVSFVRFLSALREYLGIEEPCILFVSLFNIQGYGLRPSPPHPQFGNLISELRFWDKAHLEIPPSQILIKGNTDAVAKSFADRIWQAFGYEKAPLFDQDNKFNPSG